MMWWEHPIVFGVAGAAAFIVGITTIWGKGLVPAARGIKRFFKATGQFADSVEVLFEMAEQFKPNGGRSLHDRIRRIEDKQDALGADMSTLTLDVTEIKRQVETIITEELPIITALAETLVSDCQDKETT